LKIAEIFACQGAPPGDTGGKFDTGIKDTGVKFGVVDTGGKQWEQYQTADNLK
jgi:hypothetical protein